jgi:two-component system sensor histidine kinase TctE
MAVNLHRQLLGRLMAPLVVLLLIDGVVSYGLALHFSNRAYDAGLYDSARALATQVKLVSGQAKVTLPREALEIFEWDVLDRTVFAVSSGKRGLVIGHRNFPPPPQPLAGNLEPLFYDATFDGAPIRAVAIQLPDVEEEIQIAVGETLAKRRALTHEVLAAIMIPQFILVVVVVVLLWLGIRGGLAPLDAVAAYIEKRDPNDLRPIDDPGPMEVRPLIRALNALFQAQSGAQASQRRFISNAAHQLRSPLASLQVQAERALRESEPATHAQALEHVVSGVRRVAHLARQLLTLARAEPGAKQESVRGKVDLASLARDVTADWVPRALERAVDLGYEGPEAGLVIRGDAGMLRELIVNLIDNGLRYGIEGGRITVAVKEEVVETGTSSGEGGGPGRRVVLTVDDDGPGIPPEFRDTVFDRFVRLPDSRGDGCGLGLAIVREIATAHHGQTSVADTPSGEGTRIRVVFMAEG